MASACLSKAGRAVLGGDVEAGGEEVVAVVRAECAGSDCWSGRAAEERGGGQAEYFTGRPLWGERESVAQRVLAGQTMRQTMRRAFRVG